MFNLYNMNYENNIIMQLYNYITLYQVLNAMLKDCDFPNE